MVYTSKNANDMFCLRLWDSHVDPCEFVCQVTKRYSDVQTDKYAHTTKYACMTSDNNQLNGLQTQPKYGFIPTYFTLHLPIYVM